MGLIRHLQSSLNGGQLSRRLHGRPDLAVYAVSAAEMTNIVGTVEGTGVKRPGTRYRAAALASASRLTEFVFNATQAYVLEWSEGKLRFVTNNALVLDGSDPLEVAVPYTAAEAARVSYEQSGDVLYLAHGSHQQAKLSRTAADAFTYAAFALAGGPFGDPNGNEASTVTVTGALGVAGAVTINASAAIFAEGHVGAVFRVEAEDFGAVKAWQEGIDGITVGMERRSEGRVYVAQSAGRTGYSQPIHERGSEWDGDANGLDVAEKGPYGVKWRYAYDRFGIVRITNYVSATQVQGVVERAIPTSLASTGSYRWAHGLFSAAAGYPEHVFIWRGRLWYIRDFDLAGSVSGDFPDFNEYAEDGSRQPDMAIRRRLDITDKVLWVKADRQAVILGTARGEWAIEPRNLSEPISSDNLQITRQRRHGSAEVWPVEAGGEVFFVQRGGRKIRAAAYTYDADRYDARWANLYARHATNSGVRDLAYQAEPEELLWAGRFDGTLAAHPYSPEQEVKGWSTGLAMEGSSVISQAAVPSPDGSLDDLWLLVEREGEKSIEQLGEWWDPEVGGDVADAYFLDSGLTYSGDPATHFTGAEHLAGETVTALADGVELTVTVDEDGEFDLDAAASKVHIGRLFTARLVPLPPDIQLRDGTSMGQLRRTIHMALRVIDSFAVALGLTGKPLERLFKRPANDAVGAPTMVTGWSDPKVVGGGKARNDSQTIEDRSPYPLGVSAIVQEVSVE